MRTRRAAAALTLIALAAPATAFAQSAGDNQYVDPLAGQHVGKPSPGSGHSVSSAPSAPAASAPAASTPSSAASAAPATPSAAATSAPQQPVPLAGTGFDAWIPALAGVLLIGAAVLLRRGARAARHES